MGFHFRLRWGRRADDAAPEARPTATLASGRDATIRPGEFPQFLGPDRNAIVHGVFLDPDWAAHPPLEKWRQKIGAGWGAFAVAGDLAVTQEQRGDDELIVARDRGTGEPVWRTATPCGSSIDRMGGDGPRATPTIAGGKVFAHGATGILDCLDAATGQAALVARHAQGKRREQPPVGRELLAAGDRRPRAGGHQPRHRAARAAAWRPTT